VALSIVTHSPWSYRLRARNPSFLGFLYREHTTWPIQPRTCSIDVDSISDDILICRGFLQKALLEEGFKEIADFDGVDAAELAQGE